MELSPFSQQVHAQLTAAAALGDERTRQIADALATTAQSAVRVAILDALSAATAEVTNALYEASGGQSAPAVTLHLHGEQVRFSVSVPPEDSAEPARGRTDDGEATARISLRLTEALKAEIEQAASQAELSINSWLVRAAAGALRAGGEDAGPAGWLGWQSGRGAKRVTGWVTG